MSGQPTTDTLPLIATQPQAIEETSFESLCSAFASTLHALNHSLASNHPTATLRRAIGSQVGKIQGIYPQLPQRQQHAISQLLTQLNEVLKSSPGDGQAQLIIPLRETLLDLQRAISQETCSIVAPQALYAITCPCDTLRCMLTSVYKTVRITIGFCFIYPVIDCLKSTSMTEAQVARSIVETDCEKRYCRPGKTTESSCTLKLANWIGKRSKERFQRTKYLLDLVNALLDKMDTQTQPEQQDGTPFATNALSLSSKTSSNPDNTQGALYFGGLW